MNKQSLLFFLFVVVLFGGAVNGFSQSQKDSPYTSPPSGRLIEALLKNLAARQVNVKEKAAVAEVIEQIPDEITYHCPICDKDTVHKRPAIAVRGSMWPISHLKHDRKQVEALKKYTKLEIFLDEEGFCANCTKGKLRERANLIIVIDHKEIVNELQDNDLRILNAFFRGKDEVNIQRGTNYQSEPLRNYISRLYRLLIPR